MAPTTAIPASRRVPAAASAGTPGACDPPSWDPLHASSVPFDDEFVHDADILLSPSDELAVARFRLSLLDPPEAPDALNDSTADSVPHARLDAALDRAGDAAHRSHIAAADQWRAIDDVIKLAEAQPSLYLHGLASDSRDDREFAVRAAIADLAVRLVESEHSIRTKAAQARTLRTLLPRLWSAISVGDAVAANVRSAAELVHSLSVRHDADTAREDVRDATIAALDVALTPLAQTLPPPRFRARARALAEKLQADSAERRHRQATTVRSLTLEPAADGMAWLSLLLPATIATAAYNRVDAIARQLARAQTDSTSTAGDAEHRASVGAATTDAGTGTDADACNGTDTDTDTEHTVLRTLAQFRADIAADLLCGEPASQIRATVAVTVPVLTLLGASDEVATLDGYGPIDAQTARRLAAHAPSFTRLLTHPVSGTVLDVDRTSYRPPADLKRWLALRDRTCRFPGCDTRAVNCDVDHIQDWQHGGSTVVGNLHHLCRHHHRLKHHTAWTIDEQPLPATGDVGRTSDENYAGPVQTMTTMWTSPTGYSVATPPPPF